MEVPSPDIERELESLRRRAYGPDADIAADPEAAGRLDRLERAARATTGTRDASGRNRQDPAPHHDHPAHVPHHTPEALTAPAPDPPDEPPARSPWWRTHPLWLAIATVAVSAAVAMGIAYVAAGPPPDESLAMTGDTPTEALKRNLQWLTATHDIDRDSIVGHEGFAEMSVWTGRTDTGLRCLFLTAGDAYELAASCMPAGLDPKIDFTLYSGMAELVGDDLPDGTALRFVHRGDVVDVWVRPPRAS